LIAISTGLIASTLGLALRLQLGMMAVVIGQKILCHLVEIGGERVASVLIAVQSFIGSQKDVLTKILSVSFAIYPHPDETIDRVQVALVKLTERLDLPVFRPGD
jgi:hypothetical protein